jgi:chaperonin GroES
MTKVRPLGDRVLVAVNMTAFERTTDAGIVLPETVREVSDRGHVIAVGPTVGSLNPGDEVLFPPYAGVKLAVDEDNFLSLKEADILGVVEQD